MEVIPEKLTKRPLCRVELHVHLDGAIRHETIWEICRQKGIPLPGNGSLASLTEEIRIKEPKSLLEFLKKFSIFMPAFVSDLKNLERIAYEFVEDQFNQSVAYCEARFCPQLFLAKEDSQTNCSNGNQSEAISEVTVHTIMDAVLKGLFEGEEQFGTKIRLILCCLRGHPDWSWDILKLCEEYKNKGVVGIDIAGDESQLEELDLENVENNLQEKPIFDAAKEKGIGRTIHASENGSAFVTEEALDLLHAQRIGHGYRVIEDEKIYQRCLKDGVHFEVCPHSSYITGSIRQLKLESKRHPVLRFAEDGASFSINTDDPTLTLTRLDDEYQLLRRWGFTEAHFARANFEAAKHCFLPPDEKLNLIEQLKEAYGLNILDSIPDFVSTPIKNQELTSKPKVSIEPWNDRSQ